MRLKITGLAFTLLLLSGCYLLAPFPGGYLAVGMPSAHVTVSSNVSANWSPISGTSIYYSPDYSDILFYSGRYYYVVNGRWYYSSSYRGPWSVVRTVPDVFLRIPPSHPCYRIAKLHPRYRHHYNAPKPVYAPKYSPPPKKGGSPGPGSSSNPYDAPKKGTQGSGKGAEPAEPYPYWQRR